jgi:oligopeptidase A
MVRARNSRSANAQMRQLSFATVDLALHIDYDPEQDGDVLRYAFDMLQSFSPVKLFPGHSVLTGFSHLFSSPVGYGAGYYSYKWAEVLDADAFTRFAREGLFSREVGRAFRDNILARGDSDDPDVLFRNFMGRDPDPNALLQRSGLGAAG